MIGRILLFILIQPLLFLLLEFIMNKTSKQLTYPIGIASLKFPVVDKEGAYTFATSNELLRQRLKERELVLKGLELWEIDVKKSNNEWHLTAIGRASKEQVLVTLSFDPNGNVIETSSAPK